MEKKTCSECKVEKNLSEFNTAKRNRNDGYAYLCRECEAIYSKKWRALHKEEIRIAKAKYSIDNKDKISIRGKKWRALNKSMLKARRAEYAASKMKSDRVMFDARSGVRRALVRSRKRNIKYNLDIEYAISLIPDDRRCPICGVEFNNSSEQIGLRMDAISLDRIDSNIGYKNSNIQWLCGSCNTIKSFGSADDHMAIYNHMKLNKTLDTNGNMNRKDRILLDVRSRFSATKVRSHKYKLDNDLDVEYMLSIVPLDESCPICGVKFGNSDERVGDRPNAISIDRIDSNVGYLKNNCEFICFRCNTIKSFGSASDHKDIADYMHKCNIERNINADS